MATYNERIKKLRFERELTLKDIASNLNITEATAQRYESGNGIKAIPYEKIVEYAELFGVSPCYIMGWEDYNGRKINKEIKNPEPRDPNKRPACFDVYVDALAIPLLGRVAAGVPLYDEGNIIGKIYINPEQKNSDECFGLEVVGDSMMPRMRPGDTLVVRSQSDAENGDYVVVTINGDESIVKKLQKHKDGITLISLNPAYDPMHFTNEEIETLPVLVRGRVIEIRSRV